MRAIEERGLPLVFHGAFAWGGDQSLKLCNRFIAAHALGFSWFNILHCTNWLVNGMPERFPKLKTIWIESGLAWVPFLMQRLDNEWMMRSSEVPLLKRKPERLHARDVSTRRSRWRWCTTARRSELTFKMINAETQLMLFVGLSALGHGPAVDDLRPAVPHRDRRSATSSAATPSASSISSR